jgi:pSer/pThr/pTyr-binding forkhead associated (FHA) protein
VALEVDREQLTIGRRASNDVPVPWDPNVSRVHAQLQRIGGEWTLSDDGLSRNGSYLNGTRITGDNACVTVT